MADETDLKFSGGIPTDVASASALADLLEENLAVSVPLGPGAMPDEAAAAVEPDAPPMPAVDDTAADAPAPAVDVGSPVTSLPPGLPALPDDAAAAAPPGDEDFGAALEQYLDEPPTDATLGAPEVGDAADKGAAAEPATPPVRTGREEEEGGAAPPVERGGREREGVAAGAPGGIPGGGSASRFGMSAFRHADGSTVFHAADQPETAHAEAGTFPHGGGATGEAPFGDDLFGLLHRIAFGVSELLSLDRGDKSRPAVGAAQRPHFEQVPWGQSPWPDFGATEDYAAASPAVNVTTMTGTRGAGGWGFGSRNFGNTLSDRLEPARRQPPTG